MSQRDLATAAGIGPSAVARIETGETELRLGVLVRLLDLAGFSLVAMSSDGQALWPFDIDGARDLGGRHYPAHRQVFRMARGEFDDYWWCYSQDEFFAVTPGDARDLPPRGRRRPRPRVRRGRRRTSRP